MRCCVPHCKNDSRHISKSQGITFHVFPNEPSLRTAWLKALGKESWEPKERSAVCSEHFLCEDLYETKSGLRKVRVGAVPLIVQDSNDCDFGEPAALKICRICLTMDAKLYSIRVHKLEQAFENLTGITLPEDDKLPQKLCASCSHILIRCSKFRLKSLRANSLLIEVVRKQHTLTIQNIKSINRENNLLTSSLCPKHYPVNHFDMHIDYDNTTDNIDKFTNNYTDNVNNYTDNVNKYTDNVNRFADNVNIYTDNTDRSIDDTPPPLVIKEEDNEIFITEGSQPILMSISDNIINKNGELNQDFDRNNTNEVTNNDLSEVMDTNFNMADDMDRDFVVTDKDYSTDDSLPLEMCKSRVKKKKNKVKEKTVKTKKVRKLKKDVPTEPKIDRRRKPFLNDDLNETLFTITDLSFAEQVAEIVKRQESSNYKNAVYKCTECFKGFLDEVAYNTHITRHTDQCGEHECEICKTHFKHPHALRKHITAHHTQRFSCKQCTYVTTHRQTARLHERWHKGTKYRCPHCQDEFVKFTTYMGHIRIKHPSDFVCELCGYSFVSAKGIELHKKLKHRLEETQIPEDGPLCELCNVRFISNEAYKRHLSVSARHTSTDKDGREANKPKKGRKTRESKELERRADTDLDDPDDPDRKRMYPSQLRKAEGPIPCEQCGLQLEDSRAYHGHFRRMHPDKNRTNYPSMKSPCMCEVCGRMFQSYALLKDHTWVHTGERPFKCELCDKSFRMKQRLVAHRRVHSSQRASYVCALCGKHFSTHSNRQRHMFIHTGLKPFKCEMCGKGFKHASEKRAHITYVHLKKPWPKRARGKRRVEGRPGQLSLDQVPGSDMDIATPMWATCDPKLADINASVLHKPDYYNLKI